MPAFAPPVNPVLTLPAGVTIPLAALIGEPSAELSSPGDRSVPETDAVDLESVLKLVVPNEVPVSVAVGRCALAERLPLVHPQRILTCWKSRAL